MINLLRSRISYFLISFLFLILFQASKAQIQPLFGASPAQNGPCLSRPPACPLNCANGFAWGLGNSCLCLCQVNPCANRICPLGEVCAIQAGFAVCSRPVVEASILRPNNQQSQQIRSNTVGECPILVGGSCLRRCNRDTECSTDQKCCSNGCGLECVTPVNVAPIQSSLSIRPIGQFQSKVPNFISPSQSINSFTQEPQSNPQKSGACPPSMAFPPHQQQRCNIECQNDGDCGGSLKCCKNNCDGQICVAPAQIAKSSVCVHLLSAVQHLPAKRLKAGYLPTCTANGNFAPVQCDHEFCWCVNTETGHEVWGTKVEVDERARLNCAEPRECETTRKECERKSKNRCPFGWKTDSRGCPSESCECRDLCDEIECGRKFYECQLIEPDCSEPPCQPVPKCILNPCPNGPPATLNNGVTALCTQENPCFPGYWCHEIGYNGLGFCCSEPESAKRLGSTCEAKAPSRLASVVSSPGNCESECRVDADCSLEQKCCFDGCALKCSNGKFGGFLAPKKSIKLNSGGVFSENKVLLENLNAECPNFPKPKRAMVCETECQTDSDCHGMRRCCQNGCSKICAYPSKTTACLHDAITFDLFGLRHSPRCNSKGQYHEIQCDQERCYCAEPHKGRPLPWSIVPAGQRPNCARNRQCSQLNCETNCAHGSQFDENGCPTCDCKNPCRDIECKSGGVCVMIPVECTGDSECNDQPRCVPNICQGQPASNDYDLIEQCSGDCQNGFACYSIGLPGAGGLCCPLGISSQGGVRPTTHPGECPRMDIRIQASFQLMCRADADCAIHEKCCFDGTGTMCTVIDKVSITKSKNSKLSKDKPGECQPIGSSRRDCRSGVDDCKEDLDCAGVLKCCPDGCFRKCLPAFKTTACNHLKTSLEQFGRSVMVRCTDDGEFEPTQCNNEACWCVEVNAGREIEGTRVTGSLKPDCRMRRVCQERDCKKNLKCGNGYKKDKNGCDICECSNPCQDLKCPDEDHICVSQSVTCLTSDCPSVPKCIPNVCRSGRPLNDKQVNGVKECSINSDCPPGAYCRRFGWKSGYCCGGPDNQKNAGKCPKMPEFPLHGISCSIRCRQDSDCSKSHEGCCFNGCGMECMPLGSNNAIPTSLSNRHPSISHSVDHSDHHHTQTRPTIESTCPHVQDLGHVICGNGRDNHCESDKECPNSLKCCFDGCSRSCMPPSKAPNCVHESAAVQALMRLGNSNLFQPLCTSDGLYARIQRRRDREWCVDQVKGHELAGTRTNSGIANCENPRSCRPLTCQLECDFGFRIDEDGCEECACRNPCTGIDCPLDHVCGMAEVECVKNEFCQPVPKCVLNICLRGEPLTRPNSQFLIQCNSQKKKECPPGWFCQQFGMESNGYCCAGIVPESQLQLSAQKCSPTPILYSKDSERERKIECRLARDCNQGAEACCFDGYGSVCLRNVGRNSDLAVLGHSAVSHLSKQIVQEVHGVSPIKPILNQSDRGICPLNTFQNPGCKSDCHSDGECGEFKKCCEFGCGRKCLYSDPTSSCIHRLAVLEEEQLKIERPKSLGIVSSRKSAKSGDEWQNATIQCTSSGLYKRVQCNRTIGQCWCANSADGKELIGTRSSISSRGEPNCSAPRKCSIECQKEWEECEHGVRLDKNGCPLDNQCECRNPCEDFECLGENEICVLRMVKCQPQQSCPKQPTCRPTPCSDHSSPLLSSNFVPLTCRRDSECGVGGEEAECTALATSNDENGHKVGVCCSLKENEMNGINAQAAPQQKMDLRNQKLGICPLKKVESGGQVNCVKKCGNDEDCLGVSKCCMYGCSTSCEQPAPSTNCMHIMVAVERLKNDGIPNRLSTPACDHEIGNYVNNQCDEDGSCWCVDRTTGAEITATRHSQPTFNVCEGERRKCPVECSEELTQTCPFGLDLDSNGCPRTSQCRCRNPCDQVDCPQNEICLLRSRDCSEEICLPVPVCEPNPCPDNQKPVLEARGFSQFACFHNRTRPCPSNFQCTGFDQRQIGICCPPPHRSNLNFHQDADQNGREMFAQCPHGSPYSRTLDEPPTICSTSGQNSCPSTHYCVTKPGQLHGNCCPTKRYVCNLERDIASCNRPVTRFYFDSDSQACVPFVYGGCEGNLNNFETETACSRFCIGIGTDPLTRFLHGEDNEAKLIEQQDQVYSVGFTLTGPLLRQKHTQEFNDRLRDYLMANFNLNENELRDLFVHDDNTVRFNLIAPNAQQKAANISQAVSNGGFHFRYGEESYHAEPQTWFSQQIDTNLRPTINGALFWVLLVASILFALAVVFVLWCACSFVRSRTKDNTSIFRGVSPSPYGQISAYIPQDGRSVSVASSRHSNHPQSNSASHEPPPSTNQQKQQKTVSADDLRILRQMERENRQMSSTSGAMLQLFQQQPVSETPKPRVIQRPRILGASHMEDNIESRPANGQKAPSNQGRRTNKSTIFY